MQKLGTDTFLQFQNSNNGLSYSGIGGDTNHIASIANAATRFVVANTKGSQLLSSIGVEWSQQDITSILRVMSRIPIGAMPGTLVAIAKNGRVRTMLDITCTIRRVHLGTPERVDGTI